MDSINACIIELARIANAANKDPTLLQDKVWDAAYNKQGLKVFKLLNRPSCKHIIECECIKGDTWDEMDLNPNLLKAIYEAGHDEVANVQRESILRFIDGYNLVIKENAGWGKTLCYIIPILQKIDLSLNEIQAIIIVPTNALVEQVYAEMNKLSSKVGVRIYGLGLPDLSHYEKSPMPYWKDATSIAKLQHPHVIISTVERLYEMLRYNYLPQTRKDKKTGEKYEVKDKSGNSILQTPIINDRWNNVKMFIVDEVDSIFKDTGKYKINDELEKTKKELLEVCLDNSNSPLHTSTPNIQFAFLSATMSKELQEELQEITKDKKTKLIELDTKSIRHDYYIEIDRLGKGYSYEEKQAKLFKDKCITILDLIRIKKTSLILIFCKTNDDVRALYEHIDDNKGSETLSIRKYDNETTSFEKSQMIDDLKASRFNILITTPALGRGINITKLEYVILFDLPDGAWKSSDEGWIDEYRQQRGRVGRFGKMGTSITLINDEEKKFLEQVQTKYEDIKLKELPVHGW
jgi:translation initiation factor 4A